MPRVTSGCLLSKICLFNFVWRYTTKTVYLPKQKEQFPDPHHFLWKTSLTDEVIFIERSQIRYTPDNIDNEKDMLFPPRLNTRESLSILNHCTTPQVVLLVLQRSI